MSAPLATTGRDLVRDLASLVTSIDALLETQTTAALLSLARRFRIEPPLIAAIDLLRGLLDGFDAFLEKLGRALAVAEALPAVLAEVASLLGVLGDIVGEVLDVAGLAAAVDRSDRAGAMVLAGLPTTAELSDLEARIAGLGATLASHRQSLAAPAGGDP